MDIFMFRFRECNGESFMQSGKYLRHGICRITLMGYNIFYFLVGNLKVLYCYSKIY